MPIEPLSSSDGADNGHSTAKFDVSILICSRNRALHLEQTLKSIDRTRQPADVRTEILVVDNGSTDGTAQLLASGPVRNMPFRWSVVPTPGKSRALNAAMRLAAGRVFLWTDDDVRVPEDWVERMSRPILAGRFDALSGAVVIPPDLREKLRGTLAERRTWMFASTEDIDLKSPTLMFGANMSFGRHVLERVPYFDEALGPGMLGYGEDTNFGRRLLDAGYSIGGVPDAAVEHHFDTSRVDRRAIDSMVIRMAASMAYTAFRWEGRRVRMPRAKLAKAYLAYPAKIAMLGLRGGAKADFEELRHDHISWCSYLRQMLKMQREDEPSVRG